MKIRTRLTVFFTLILFVLILALSFWYQYRLYSVLRQETYENLDKFTNGLLGHGRPGTPGDIEHLLHRLTEIRDRDNFSRQLSLQTWFALYTREMQVIMQTPFAEDFPLPDPSSFLNKKHFSINIKAGVDYFKARDITPPEEYRPMRENEFYTGEKNYIFHCAGRTTRVHTTEGTYFFVTLIPDNRNSEYLKKTLVNVIISLFISLCIIIPIGLFYAGYSLNPINKIIHEMNSISERNISRRITIKKNSTDEIGVVSLSINNLLDRIENAFIMEKQFISDVSHEFKTPLSILQLNTEFFANKPGLTDEEMDRISASMEIIYYLSLLIQKLLYLSRLESNLCAFNPTSIQIRRFLESVMNNLQGIAEMKKLEFTLSPVDEPLTINGDEEILYIAFYNIIENALKYTNRGHVTVHAGKKNNTVEISIEDTGTGIPGEKKDRIFDKFFRADPTRHDTKSFGIGLTIAKRILDIHGAVIHVQTEENRGTTFSIRFAVGE
ncbi:MAG: HAMP domain-containing histidine kinase [Spirochaetales bacterium]|nr:HAMP domain-containing histidine kinase [Spirochaetales bacterium]